MNVVLKHLTLADLKLSESLVYYFRTTNGWNELGMFLIGILCVVSFWMMLVYWKKLIIGIRPHEPEQDKIFQDLCTVHKLSWGETSYLKALVETLQLAEPAYVFVNPRYLDTYANHGDEKAKQLRLKLFA